MKALKRKEGETVTEADGIPGIDWKTGMPLTCPDWAGGPYRLVNDYVPDDSADDGATYGCTDSSAASQPADPTPAADGATYGCTDPSAASQPADAPVQDPAPDTIVIDGVTYTRAP